jgi:long-chain acyl-CoA synthetase
MALMEHIPGNRPMGRTPPRVGPQVAHPTVAELFAWTAQRLPDKVAAKCGDTTRVYADLDSRANALASYLQRSVRPGTRVGLFAGNCIPWVETMLACAKAGIPVVPINSRYESTELCHIIADAEIGFIVYDALCVRSRATGDLLARLPRLSCGEDYEQIVNGDVPPVTPRAAAEDMVVYTSGTTSTPKGVRYTSQNQVVGGLLLNTVLQALSMQDRLLVGTPLAHRVAQVRVVCGLLLGATVHLVDRPTPGQLVDLVAREEITVTGTVPTVIGDLAGLDDASIPDALASLRYVHVTGQAMPAFLRERAMSLFPNARICTCYASTETGLVTVLEHEDQLARPDSCGRALPGIEVAVVDEQGSAVPSEQAGELVARSGLPGSSLVAGGYVGRAADRPFTDADGWFHTGDIATLDGEGWCRIVDRKKDMVLSGGLNIASAEVESLIASCPGVAEVAVTGEPDDRFGERVVAWVVPRAHARLTAEAIQSHVAAQAASYKKPRVVHFLERLPRTPAGKVSKTALRRRSTSDTETEL